MALLDLSLLASAVLAVGWSFASARPTPPTAEGSAATSKSAADVAFACLDWVHGVNQLLPALLLTLAATSPLAAIRAAISFDFGGMLWLLGEESKPEGSELGAPQWLGGDAGSLRHLLLALSLIVWRAEKLESLLQRMQRSVKFVQGQGLGSSLGGLARDPMGYGWPAAWGVSRRIALVSISSFGCVPFMQTAYPAVVLDEASYWFVASASNLWERKVSSVPMVVNIVLLPIADLVHFIPVIVKVLLLGLTVYPSYASPGFLVASALAWTAHNLHVVYTTLVLDVPESARQLWAARNQGG